MKELKIHSLKIFNPESFLTMFHKNHSKTAISNVKRKSDFFSFLEGLNCRFLLWITRRIRRKFLKIFDLVDCKIITFEVKK
jgi:hypothetical protein